MLYFFIGVIVTLIFIILVSSLFPSVPFFAWINCNLATFQAIGSLAILLSAIVAIRIYWYNFKRHQKEDKYKASEAFLRESILILERSFDIFTDKGAHTNPPRNDRLLWLTTARFIHRFYKMLEKVSENKHREIIDEHEEYHRFQFNKLLDENKDNFTKEYFKTNNKKYLSGSIDRKSIAVIFDFAKWKEGMIDPLTEVNDKELFSKDVILPDQNGALEFLREQSNKYWEEVQEIKRQRKNTEKD